MRHFSPTAQEATVLPALLIEAARCWREARDRGALSQPCLSDMLAAHGDGAMLAPVLDSLCLLYEAALGRPMAVGEALTLSDDEHVLLGLVEGSAPRRCLNCAEGTATALDCALCSTRIMLALNLGRSAAPTAR